MENLLGLIRVRVIKGRNLPMRDIRGSDPYIVLHQGAQGGERKRDQSCLPLYMAASLPPVEQLLGLLRVRVVKGMNLAVRDVSASDSYVILKMGEQKLKTRVVSNNVNPEWNEELTFSIAEPIMPIKLVVFDKDTFTTDDLMGDAELDILPLIEATKMDMEGTTGAATLHSVLPSQENCLAEESRILWLEGKVVQDVCLRLRNVECGEVELQLQWISLPGSKTI